MKIAIVGYGKMGKAIERIALERGHEIKLKIASVNKELLSPSNLAEADVIIEFTNPDSAEDNLSICAASGTPTISGTTGWLKNYDQICDNFEKHDNAFLYASNFSVGVNLFFALNEKLAGIMAPWKSDYQASIDEVHHIHKLDAPSGTAISLAEGIIDQSKYESWVNKAPKKSDELPIISHREAEVFGIHIINYMSDLDLIQIKHEARSRDGFALGAVLAAEFIANKKGIYSMKDVLKI